MEHESDTHQALLAGDYLKNGPSPEKVKSMSFHDLSLYLRQVPLLRASDSMLSHLVALLRRDEATNVCRGLNYKIILAAYMFSLHPSKVFEKVGPSEQSLIDASMPMLECFHRTAVGMAEGRTWGSLRMDPLTAQPLSTLLSDYLRKFMIWKQRDERRLVGMLTQALDANKDMADKLDPAMDDFDDMRKELMEKEAVLRARLVSVAGEKGLQDYLGRRSAGIRVPNSCGLSNEQLAHELLLDENFRIDMPSYDGRHDKLVATKMRDQYAGVDFAHLLTQLQRQPPVYDAVLGVVSMFESTLVCITKSKDAGHRVGAFVRKFRLQLPTSDRVECVSLLEELVQLMLWVCDTHGLQAAREEIRTRWTPVQAETKPGIICEALELMVYLVRCVQVNGANAKLDKIVPVITQHGYMYARTQFESRRLSGEFTLEKTTEWLDTVVARLLTSDASDCLRGLVSPAQLASGEEPVYESVLMYAVLQLVLDTSAAIPETLALDSLRITSLRDHFHTDVLSLVYMQTVYDHLATFTTLDAHERVSIALGVQRVLVQSPPKPCLPLRCVERVVAAVPSASQSGLEALLQQKLGGDAYTAAETKIMIHWASMLVEEGRGLAGGKADLPEYVMPLLRASRPHVKTMAKMLDVNMKVHTEYYHNIIKEAAARAPTTRVVGRLGARPSALLEWISVGISRLVTSVGTV
jgi:hypothetical protein